MNLIQSREIISSLLYAHSKMTAHNPCLVLIVALMPKSIPDYGQPDPTRPKKPDLTRPKKPNPINAWARLGPTFSTRHKKQARYGPNFLTQNPTQPNFIHKKSGLTQPNPSTCQIGIRPKKSSPMIRSGRVQAEEKSTGFFYPTR